MTKRKANVKHVSKLRQAEEKLGVVFPQVLFDFISTLRNPEVKFGGEEWLFWTITDKQDDPDDNFIVKTTLDFQKEWRLKGLVFATNGLGDYILLLPDEETGNFLPQVFIMMHETAEIKQFASSWSDLIEYGPDGYFWDDEFYVKLDDENNVIKGSGLSQKPVESHANRSGDKEFFDDDHTLRDRLDDLIDDERTDLASEIIQGLEELNESDDVTHKVWALNKLSDIYLRGFGPIPRDMTKALAYNQSAIDLNSHKAYSNRAACYFFGMGLDKDLSRALEFATKANELSKANLFADIFAKKKDGGMYDSLVDMIKKELKKRGK